MFAATHFPIIPLVLVMFAGIALRYSIWYGSSRKCQTCDATDELTAQLEVLQTFYTEVSKQRDSLLKKCDQLNNQLVSATSTTCSLSGELEALSSVHAELDRSRTELRATVTERNSLSAKVQEIARNHHMLSNRLADLAVEKDSISAKLTDAVAEKNRTSTRLIEVTGEKDRTSTKLIAVTAEKDQVFSRLQKVTINHDRLAPKLQAATEQREALQTQLQLVTEQRDDLTKQLEAVAVDDRKIEQLEKDLNCLLSEKESLSDQLLETKMIRVELQEVRIELEVANQNKKTLLEQLHAEKEQMRSWKAQWSKVSGTRDQAEQLRTAHPQQFESLQNGRNVLKSDLRDQRNTARQSSRDLRVNTAKPTATVHQPYDNRQNAVDLQRPNEAVQVEEECPQLKIESLPLSGEDLAVGKKNTSLAKKESEANPIAANLSTTTSKFGEHEANPQNLHNSLECLKSTHSDGLVPIAEQQHEFEECAANRQQDIEIKTQDSLERATNKQTEIDRLAVANRKLEATIGKLQDQLGQRDARLRSNRIEKEETLTRLEQERNARAVLESTLNKYRETWEHVPPNSTSPESLLEPQTAFRNVLQKPTQRFQEILTGDRAKAIPDRSKTPDNEVFLTSDGDRQSKNSAATNQSFEKLTLDERLGWVYTSPPNKSDNLQGISGVSQILEKKLHALGIYKFSQIKQWTPEIVIQVSEQLKFQDRIEREDWITQASRLDSTQKDEAA